MSKCLIVYFSQGGTTAQVAERIATGLRGEGYQVDLCNMNGQQPPDVRDYDLFGVGAPVYYFRPPFNVDDYLNSLPDLGGMPAFAFVMYGTYRFDAGNKIRRALASKGAREVGYFHARGADFFVGYLKQGYLFSPGHPVDGELAQAETFGRDVAAHVVGRQYIRPEDDPSPSMIYRLERFSLGRWFTRQVYTRLFSVDKDKCTACGLCMELCPVGNITEGKGRRPVWGRNCLLCLTCELKCPEEAISSPVSWPLIRPFMIYNTRCASRDPSIEHVRIDRRSWSQASQEQTK
jgi:flavodoxin/ferredoxin